jgi:uncharacterized repeat protein (TIGR01451 family)
VVVLNSLSGATPVFTAATLAPGAVGSFSGSYLAPTNCASTSTATATAASSCGVSVSANAFSTCTVLTTPLISVTTVCPAAPVLQGSLLTYTGVVSNAGKITLTNIIVTSDRPTTNSILFTVATLAPGASTNFTGSYLVPTNCCVVSGTVYASGQGCDGTIATDSDTRTCTVLTLPQLVVTKNCTSPGLLHAGDLLTYGGTVSNAGNIVLINVRVENDQTPNSPPVAGPLTLAPGESYDYVASYIVPADFCGTDTITASGLNACTLLTVTNRVTTTCPVVTPPPRIAITKNCPLLPTPRGGLYTFTGTVSNPGKVTLVDVYVVDNEPASNTPVLGPITLAPGEVVTFTNSYIAPKCCCLIVDTLTATGQGRCSGVSVTAKATTVCPLLSAPAIAVVPNCPPAPILKGTFYRFSGYVTNTGDVTLTNVFVFGPQGTNAPVAGPLELAPGEAAPYFGFYTVPPDTCSVAVTASGRDTCGGSAIAHAAGCPVLNTPQIVLTQDCPPGPVRPGGLLTFTGTVRNAGDITLTNVVVRNDRSGITPLLTVASLAPGASTNFIGSYLAPTNCSSTSLSIATGRSLCGTEVTNTAGSTCPVLTTPLLALTVNCPAGPVLPGGPLVYGGTVRNTGDITLTNVVVVSDRPVANTRVLTLATLAPGAATNFTSSLIAPANACSVTTGFRATGSDICTLSAVTNTATTTCPVLTTQGIVVTLACPDLPAAPGGPVTFSGTVRNSGNVTLTNVSVLSGVPPSGPPIATRITRTNGAVVVSWTATPGATYRVQYRTNLEDPNWTDLAGDVTPSGTEGSKEDATGPDAQRFYRVVLASGSPVTGPSTLAPGAVSNFTFTVIAQPDACSVSGTVRVQGISNCSGTPVTDTATATCALVTTPGLLVTQNCPPSPVSPGGLLTITGTVKNTGNITLNNVVVTNDHTGNLPLLTVLSLAPGASTNFTGSYTAPATGPSTSTSTARGTSLCGVAAANAASSVCPILTTPGLAVTKLCPAIPVAPGGLLTFTGTVTNTGNVTLTNVFVVNNQPSPNTPVLGPITLAPGTGTNFTRSYLTPLNGCEVTDTLTATGNSAATGIVLSQTATATCTLVTTPGLLVTQNCPPSPVSPGGLLTITGTVKNTGNITLSNVVVTNDHTGNLPLLTVLSLAPGASTNFTGSYTAPATGPSTSTSTARGTSLCGQATANAGSSVCPILTTPGLAVTKQCPAVPVAPGGLLTFTGTVTNTGNVTLTNVFVVNNQPAPNTPVLGPITLAPGAGTNFTRSYLAPLNACEVTDTLTATGNSAATGIVLSQTATATCTLVTTPGLLVTQNCPPSPVSPGGLLTITGTVKNTGNITLNNVVVTNDHTSNLPLLTVLSLAPGASTNFTGSYTAPATGPSTSTSTARGTSLCGQAAANAGSSACPILTTPGLSVTKQCPAVPVAPGGLLTFTGTVTNTGNVTLTNVFVVNNQPVPNTPVLGPITLAPGAGTNFTRSYLTPLNVCEVTDTLTATGNSAATGIVLSQTATATCTLVTTPGLLVTQNCPPSPVSPGGLLTISGTVKNTGNITLNNVVVTNDHTGNLPLLTVLSLAPGASTNFTGSYTAPATGPSTSTSTARGTSLCGQATSNAGSSACPILTTPGLAVTKLCPAVPVAPGGLLTFTGTVTNTGNVTLTNVFVVNNQPVPNTPVLGPITLAPGAGTNFTRSYLTPLNVCEVTDTLTATGNSAATGLLLSNTATATCALVTTPAIAVSETCPPGPVTAGSTVTFAGEVNNPGDITLTNVFVFSGQPTNKTPLLGPITLAPGASAPFTGSYVALGGSNPTTNFTIITNQTVMVVTNSTPVVTTNAVTPTFGTINPVSGALADHFNVLPGLSGLMYADQEENWGPTLFYSIRHPASGPDQFETISTIPPVVGAVTDRFSLSSAGYDALTLAAPDVGYGAVNFYYVRHNPAGAFTFGVIKAAGASSSADLWAIPGTGYTGLAFAAADVGGYGANLFYYVRQGTTGISTFGTINPTPGGIVTDRYTVAPNTDTLVFVPGAVSNWGTALFAYLRHDDTGSIIGTIDPVTHLATDRLHLGTNRLSTLTFTATDVGYGPNQFYYLRPAGSTLQTNLVTTFTTNTVLTFQTNSVVLFTPTNTVTAVGIDICQARTVTAAANCLGPVAASPLPVLPMSLNGPALSMSTRASGHFTLNVPTEIGKTYTVQFKNALSDPAWTDLETVEGTGDKLPVLDMDAAQHPTRFYRVVSTP